MPDQSHLDSRYFIDDHVYNCPYCRRRHVLYYVSGQDAFDWSENRRCYVYYVECQSCLKISMHLSNQPMSIKHIGTLSRGERWRWQIGDVDLDRAFFYSVPSSFFVVDQRIPLLLRELLTEAEGCWKSNFLTGASACARKVVYELATREGAVGTTYDERLRSLKDLYPGVDPTYFDTLLTIQEVTSSKVHEEAYDGWEARHLSVILAALHEVLYEVYVAPKEKEARRNEILRLKEEVNPSPVVTPGQSEGDT